MVPPAILHEDELERLPLLWWAIMLRGLLGILLGIIACFMPVAALLALVYLFGPMPSLTESSTACLNFLTGIVNPFGVSQDMVRKQSAGILLYRLRTRTIQALLVHPGGPFGARKDDGVWSIPKGEYENEANGFVVSPDGKIRLPSEGAFCHTKMERLR
ncbi:MAG: hypothetical protein P0119_12605 [Nitrospira sp.]|nr:hypothetical protein [Nitrospira sp.]